MLGTYPTRSLIWVQGKEDQVQELVRNKNLKKYGKSKQNKHGYITWVGDPQVCNSEVVATILRTCAKNMHIIEKCHYHQWKVPDKLVKYLEYCSDAAW